MTDISATRQANALAALIREVDGGHSLGASALADALIAKGVRVLQLPAVEIDDFGDRVIKIPRGMDPSMTGQIRLSQGSDGDRIAITGLPADLEINYAPAWAAAFMAASAAMAQYEEAPDEGLHTGRSRYR